MSRDRAIALGVLWVLFFVENALHYLFPDMTFSLVLVCVIFFSLKEGVIFGSVLGFWAGLLFESLKTGPFGFAALPLLAVGAFSGFMSSKIFRESFMAQIVIPAVSVYFFQSVNLGVIWEDLLFLQILLTVFLSPVVFFCLKRLTDQSASRRSPRWLF